MLQPQQCHIWMMHLMKMSKWFFMSCRYKNQLCKSPSCEDNFYPKFVFNEWSRTSFPHHRQLHANYDLANKLAVIFILVLIDTKLSSVFSSGQFYTIFDFLRQPSNMPPRLQINCEKGQEFINMQLTTGLQCGGLMPQEATGEGRRHLSHQ